MSILVLGNDIAIRGQYYWLLGGLLGIVLTLVMLALDWTLSPAYQAQADH